MLMTQMVWSKTYLRSESSYRAAGAIQRASQMAQSRSELVLHEIRRS